MDFQRRLVGFLVVGGGWGEVHMSMFYWRQDSAEKVSTVVKTEANWKCQGHCARIMSEWSEWWDVRQRKRRWKMPKRRVNHPDCHLFLCSPVICTLFSLISDYSNQSWIFSKMLPWMLSKDTVYVYMQVDFFFPLLDFLSEQAKLLESSFIFILFFYFIHCLG